MPKTIVKPDVLDDFYVDWSDIVEAPTAWGTRAGMAAYGVEEERLERADRMGTSALWPSAADPKYAFSDDTFIYDQRGIVRRRDLKLLCERIAADADVADLLEPFEDG